MKCEGWLVGAWDGYRWDGSHRFQCKLKSSHPNPTTYKIWSYSTKLPPQEFLVEFDFPAKDAINYYDQVKSTYPIKAFTFLTFFYQLVVEKQVFNNHQKASKTMAEGATSVEDGRLEEGGPDGR